MFKLTLIWQVRKSEMHDFHCCAIKVLYLAGRKVRIGTSGSPHVEAWQAGPLREFG